METPGSPKTMPTETTKSPTRRGEKDQTPLSGEEVVASILAEMEFPALPVFSIQDMAKAIPKENRPSAKIYKKRKSAPSKIKMTGNPSQGSEQAEGGAPVAAEMQTQGEQGKESHAGEPAAKKVTEPSTETTLPEGGKKPTARALEFEDPIRREEESTESETSQEQRMKTEQRKKTRTLTAVKQAEEERQKEEKRVAAEKKRKGKGIASPPPRRSIRQASRSVSIREPEEKEIIQETSSDEVEEVPDLGKNAYDKVTIEVNDQIHETIATFTDEEDQEIYKLKSDPSTKNRVHHVLDSQSLERLGVKDKFLDYMFGIGFGWFTAIGGVQFPLEFAEEFFATFRFESTLDPESTLVSFRLLGVEFKMNLKEWVVRLGVVKPEEVEKKKFVKLEIGVPGKNITFDGVKEWRKVAGKDAADFCANKSLGADIQDPVLRLVQIYLGLNLLGQQTCLTRVSLTELYFMRRVQEGKKINLAFWLAYQAHQINRSKSRHLTLCHIPGIFFYRNINMIRASKGLRFELCIVPRAFNLDYLLEHQIVRLVQGAYGFYEPGKFAPKPRKKPNVLQIKEGIQAGQMEGKYSWESLVDEVHAQREKIDSIFSIVDKMWNALKRVDERRGAAPQQKAQEEGQKEAEGHEEPANVEEPANEEEIVEQEEQEEEEEKDEQKEEDESKENSTVESRVLPKKREIRKEQVKQKKNEDPTRKPETRKRSHPSQGSPSASTPRSKRGM